jgi:predicted DNA-binding transcriptional regulator YafY
MKTDRLLSIIIYLLNHDLASARELSERFEVSIRTIQRDMESIELAGIPIYTLQGAGGGYGILDSWKMDRRLMSNEDLYYIITALEGVGDTLSDRRINGTLEKVKGLLSPQGLELFSGRTEKLSIDFSMLGGDPRERKTFRIVQEAVETERIIRFSYTNKHLETVLREVEPMTIAFRWRGWYLFGFCRLKGDYRLFRISRIRNAEVLERRFQRKEMSLQSFLERNKGYSVGRQIDIELSFSPEMRAIAEDMFPEEVCSCEADGSILVRTTMPEDGWLYGYILSFGHYVQVRAPEHLKEIICEGAEKIISLYQ